MNQGKKTKPKRTGAAMVEMAICLPILILLTFGTIESNNAIFLKQTLTSAAHEGALTGMSFNSTEAEVLAKIELILEGRDLEDCIVTITPSGAAFDQLSSGESFSIEVNKNVENSFFNAANVSAIVSSQRP